MPASRNGSLASPALRADSLRPRIRALSADELTFVLQHHWSTLGLTRAADDFTDTEATAAVYRITSGNSASYNDYSHRSLASWRSTGLRTITPGGRQDRPRVPRHRRPLNGDSESWDSAAIRLQKSQRRRRAVAAANRPFAALPPRGLTGPPVPSDTSRSCLATERLRPQRPLGRRQPDRVWLAASDASQLAWAISIPRT
jgi:hypothetical protein